MEDDETRDNESVEDLDKRIKRDLRYAAIAFDASYSEKIIAGIAAIGQISQVANARIQTDTRVAAARIASHAEVSCIELLSTAELAALRIDQMQGDKSNKDKKENKESIDAIAEEASQEIEDSCNSSIAVIKGQGELAIAQINENATEAIAKFQQHVSEVKLQIKKNEIIAEEKLEASKQEERTLEEIEINAEQAKSKIVDFAKEITSHLADLSSEVVTTINKRSELALEEITNTIMAAETKIKEMKNVALTRLQTLFG